MKRFYSVFLAIAILFALAIPAMAAGEVTFTIGSVEANPGASIQVPITVAGNPGISAMQIDITLGAGLEWDYDPLNYTTEQSTWPFISSSDVLALTTTRPMGANLTSSTARLLFPGDGGNVTTNGTLVTLKLKVKGDAQPGKEVPINMNVYSCYNETDAAVPYNPITPGKVTVKPGKPKDGLPTLKHEVAGAKVGFAEPGLPINFSLTLDNYPNAEEMGDFDDYALTTYVTLSEGLTFDPDSVSVTIGGVVFEAGTYTISTTDIDGATFKVTIPIQSGSQYPAGWESSLKDQFVDKTIVVPIVIEYQAALNASAVVYDTVLKSFNTSTAVLHYPSDDPSLGKTTEELVGVYTFQFNVTKVDINDHNTLLPGAVFELRDSEEGQAIPLTAKAGNVYRVDRNGASTVTSITTDASGKFTIEGLAAPQAYYLVETKEPDGYVLPRDPATKVQFDAVPASVGTTLASLVMSVDDDPISGYSITIENSTDSFGGMGTMLFTVGGAALMAAAFVLFMAMRKRRMRGMA